MQSWKSWGGIALACALSAACEKQPTAPAKAAVAPPSVSVSAAQSKQIRQHSQFVGQTTAVEDVSLRARVQGYVVERLFTEGKDVDKGETLLLIDPSTYEAQVDIAEGALAQAKAERDRYDKEAERYKTMVKKGAVSQEKYDQVLSQSLSARAAVKSREAELTKRKLELSFTTISAPISGRIGRAQVSVGDLVDPGSGELARLTQLDPIYVTFSISETVLVEVQQKALKTGKKIDTGDYEIRLQFANGTIYKNAGYIDFVDNRVNVSTGTLAIRGRFDNPSRVLVPGQYVTVLLQGKEQTKQLVVPQVAVQEDQTGRFVLVVDKDKKVEVRKVYTGDQVGTDWVIQSGLEDGEQVIVQGLKKVRPGMLVNAQPAMALSTSKAKGN